MLAIRLILGLLACGLMLSAQPWDDLRRLHPGDKITILDTARNEVRGRFQAFSPDSISVETGGGPKAIERTLVRRVQVRSGSRRLRNALIGAAIGVAVAVTVDQTIGTYLRNETGDSGRAITYVAPIAAFGAIGAILPSYRTVYRAP